MKNVMFTFPHMGCEVHRIISMEDAIDIERSIASGYGTTYLDDSDALTNLLKQPNITLTDKPIGKIIGAYLQEPE